MPRTIRWISLLPLMVSCLVILGPSFGQAPNSKAGEDLEPGGPSQSGREPVLVGATEAPWVDPAWSRRVLVSVKPDSIQGTGALRDFPVLVRVTGDSLPEVFIYAKPDGSDLLITKRDGVTVLSREVVSFDPGLLQAEVWFRADSLSKTVRDFYLYFGNPNAALPGADPLVWHPDYIGVYHFAENPGLGILKDYSQGLNNATAGAAYGWTAGNLQDGVIGKGWRFNGTTNWIDADNLTSPDTTFTISGWFGCWNQLKPGDADFAFSSDTAGGWHLSAKRNNQQRNPDFYRNGATLTWGPNPLPDTLLHQYTWVMDGVGDTVRLYYDGVERSVISRFISSGSHYYTGNKILGNVSIGGPAFYNTVDTMQGIMDEFRVFEGTRTPEWIRTEYRNQKKPVTFFSYGNAQIATGVGPEPEARLLPLRASPNPFHARTTVLFDLVRETPVEARIFDLAGRTVAVLQDGPAGPGVLRLTWDGRDRFGRPAAAGVYLVRVRTVDATGQAKIVLLP